jgi:hypothetical protein
MTILYFMFFDKAALQLGPFASLWPYCAENSCLIIVHYPQTIFYLLFHSLMWPYGRCGPFMKTAVAANNLFIFSYYFWAKQGLWQ